MRDDGDWNMNGTEQGMNKELEYECGLQVEPDGFTSELKVGCEGKRQEPSDVLQL